MGNGEARGRKASLRESRQPFNEMSPLLVHSARVAIMSRGFRSVWADAALASSLAGVLSGCAITTGSSAGSPQALPPPPPPANPTLASTPPAPPPAVTPAPAPAAVPPAPPAVAPPAPPAVAPPAP